MCVGRGAGEIAAHAFHEHEGLSSKKVVDKGEGLMADDRVLRW